MVYENLEICCPACKRDLWLEENEGQQTLHCESCKKQYPIIFGIPDLRVFPDPYIDFEADRAKGLKVAAKFDALTFSGLIDYYYSITPVVPPQHARQYKRGLMAAVPRANASLNIWSQAIDQGQPFLEARVLEIGCGTAPLLVAASDRFERLVGIDIAFRWLVVAKKRLAEAHIEAPLICACAEALPFPDRSFDLVLAESTVELLQDQRQGVAESQRVLRPKGYFCFSTPNRYSLGPDPHAGILAGGWLPESWLAAYVRRQGGIPPKRNLLSVASLSKLLIQTGFSKPRLFLPEFPAEQKQHFGRMIQLAIDLYTLAKSLPVSRQVLYLIGPLLYVVSRKTQTDRTQEQVL